MIKVILNYESVPESNKIYLFDMDENSDEYKRMMSCHRNYMGSVKEGEWNEWLYEFLEKPEAKKKVIFDSENEDIGRNPIDLPAGVYIQSGFLL